MDSARNERALLQAREADARLDARVRRVSLLWWAAVFAFSCLLNFALAAEAPRALLGDVANYAAGSGAAAAWSRLLVGRLSRRPWFRRTAVGVGFALAVLGAVVSGSVAALAGGLAAAALGLPQGALYQLGFDLEHYAALFVAWYFICLLLFSVEQTARIEEGVVRLRVLAMKAEDAALRERVRPEALSESFARVGAALVQQRSAVAEGVVLALAEDLRRALSSQAEDALGEDRRAFGEGDLAGTGRIDRQAPDGGAWVANYRLVDCAFWASVFVLMFVSIAPVYAHSGLNTKAFALVELIAFCLGGGIVSFCCRVVWRRLGVEMQWAKKIAVVMAIAIGAAFVSACFPTLVVAVFWGRVGPILQAILTPVEYYIPLYVVWHCVYFYAEAIRREMAQRTLLAEAAEAAAAARNSMLRYQVRPHFLFNALNALFALIADGHWERAAAMTEALSAYIERSFAEDERELVPICEQAEALRTYLSIERVRFGDRLRIRLEIPERLAAACAPSLILQPLIENAMKYAVGATADPVDVEISAELIGDTLLLRVRDSGADAQAPAAPGLGIGLRNVAARLAGHYGERGLLECKRLTPKGFAAEIRLPLPFASMSSAA